MVRGNSQLNRYFNSAAVEPLVCSGHTSTLRACMLRSSNTVTIPPTLPEPEALDQIMLGSTGSGVANPLSPPVTGCHTLREIGPPEGTTGAPPRPPLPPSSPPSSPAPRPPPPPKRPPPERLLLGPRYELPSCLLP